MDSLDTYLAIATLLALAWWSTPIGPLVRRVLHASRQQRQAPPAAPAHDQAPPAPAPPPRPPAPAPRRRPPARRVQPGARRRSGVRNGARSTERRQNAVDGAVQRSTGGPELNISPDELRRLRHAIELRASGAAGGKQAAISLAFDCKPGGGEIYQRAAKLWDLATKEG